MNAKTPPAGPTARHTDLLAMLEGLLAIHATEVRPLLPAAVQLVAQAFHADSADIFLADPTGETLVAVASSDTPLGWQQRALERNQLAISPGDQSVCTLQTGASVRWGERAHEPALPKRAYAPGMGSTVTVPLDVAGNRRGVLQVTTAEPARLTAEDVRVLEVASDRIGMMLHRAEVVLGLTRPVAAQVRRKGAPGPEPDPGGRLARHSAS